MVAALKRERKKKKANLKMVTEGWVFFQQRIFKAALETSDREVTKLGEAQGRFQAGSL